MIRFRKLHKSYIIDPIWLQAFKRIIHGIEAGDMVPIIGSSGFGKSTLFNVPGIFDSYNSDEYNLKRILMRNLIEKSQHFTHRIIRLKDGIITKNPEHHKVPAYV
jgi:ABC-type lipoprotein export system ATPase subunit